MNVFVGCSSRDKINEKYWRTAEKLAIALSKNQYDLVFGACNNSSMGYLYRTMKINARKITGIVPESYKEDLKDLDCDIEIIAESCCDRNLKLIRNSDAIIFLAGGIGTLQEILTAIEAKRTNEFDKPIVIVNEFGYFDKFIDFLEFIYAEDFSADKTRDVYYVTDNIDDCVKYIKEYKRIA